MLFISLINNSESSKPAPADLIWFIYSDTLYTTGFKTLYVIARSVNDAAI